MKYVIVTETVNGRPVQRVYSSAAAAQKGPAPTPHRERAAQRTLKREQQGQATRLLRRLQASA